MTEFLFIMQFVLAIIITIAVLLQKSSSIGLGAYSGSNESLFGAKGPAGFLAKFTFAVGLVFVANTIALVYMYNQQKNNSLVESISTSVPAPIEAPSAPVAPSTPVNTDNK
ncbi:MAG: preprotein translocase subunit SecG [Campylobacteraceae bacterium]|jgi:preprotein translocase subunit SecG|nr:preprotein translocase subunit SecG [Campylobacteraceae bacterium]